jgi:hypothetical protein
MFVARTNLRGTKIYPYANVIKDEKVRNPSIWPCYEHFSVLRRFRVIKLSWIQTINRDFELLSVDYVDITRFSLWREIFVDNKAKKSYFVNFQLVFSLFFIKNTESLPKMDLDMSEDSDLEMAILEDILPKRRRKRQFNERKFGPAIDEITRQQQHRVPLEVVNYLVEKLSPLLKHPTRRNKPLEPQEQIEVFLQFLGNNAFYHLLRDARGPSSHTVFRVVHRVSEAVNTLQDDIIRWPEDCSRLASDFLKLGGFPRCAGCLDGTHVMISPPSKDEISFLNRHHQHSINALAVAGPDLKIYYLNANFPGRCHDSNVLRSSSLWRSFEDAGNRPFEGAVLLGDSAYPLRPWLMTPFPGDPDGAKGRYNKAHIQTRNVVERAFGVMKNRFFALKTGLRLKDPKKCSNIIISAVILHNLCIKFGDNGEDLSESEDEDEPEDEGPLPGEDEEVGPERERRRNQLLNFFQR